MALNGTFVLTRAQELVNENEMLKLQTEAMQHEIANKETLIQQLESQLIESTKLRSQESEVTVVTGTPYSLQYINSLKAKLQEFAQANQEFQLFTQRQQKKFNEQLYFLKTKNDELQRENKEITEQLQRRGIILVSENKSVEAADTEQSSVAVETMRLFQPQKSSTTVNTDLRALEIEELELFKEAMGRYFGRAEHNNTGDFLVKSGPSVPRSSQRDEEMAEQIIETFQDKQDEDSIYEMQLHISKKPSTYESVETAQGLVVIEDTLENNDQFLPSIKNIHKKNEQAAQTHTNDEGRREPQPSVQKIEQTMEPVDATIHVEPSVLVNSQYAPTVQHNIEQIRHEGGPEAAPPIEAAALPKSPDDPVQDHGKKDTDTSRRVSVEFQRAVTILPEQEKLCKVCVSHNEHDEAKFMLPLFESDAEENLPLRPKPKGSVSKSEVSLDEERIALQHVSQLSELQNVQSEIADAANYITLDGERHSRPASRLLEVHKEEAHEEVRPILETAPKKIEQQQKKKKVRAKKPGSGAEQKVITVRPEEHEETPSIFEPDDATKKQDDKSGRESLSAQAEDAKKQCSYPDNQASEAHQGEAPEPPLPVTDRSANVVSVDERESVTNNTVEVVVNEGVPDSTELAVEVFAKQLVSIVEDNDSKFVLASRSAECMASTMPVVDLTREGEEVDGQEQSNVPIDALPAEQHEESALKITSEESLEAKPRSGDEDQWFHLEEDDFEVKLPQEEKSANADAVPVTALHEEKEPTDEHTEGDILDAIAGESDAKHATEPGDIMLDRLIDDAKEQLLK